MPASRLELSVDEVRALWSFLHGDIMAAGTRQYLRASLGLCPRHTWGYAVVEIELWKHGAGARGGHQPFGVSVLYEDLLEHTAGQLTRPRHGLRRDRVRVPAPRNRCLICMETRKDRHSAVMQLGYGGLNARALTAEANDLIYTTLWCQETASLWMARSCPRCPSPATADSPQALRPDTGPEVTAMLCRHHLGASGPLSPDAAERTRTGLLGIKQRLVQLTRSMSDRGDPASEEDNASWVEALSWFAGWGLPRYLASQPDAVAEVP